jgi:hypothetical protein
MSINPLHANAHRAARRERALTASASCATFGVLASGTSTISPGMVSSASGAPDKNREGGIA